MGDPSAAWRLGVARAALPRCTALGGIWRQRRARPSGAGPHVLQARHLQAGWRSRVGGGMQARALGPSAPAEARSLKRAWPSGRALALRRLAASALCLAL